MAASWFSPPLTSLTGELTEDVVVWLPVWPSSLLLELMDLGPWPRPGTDISGRLEGTISPISPVGLLRFLKSYEVDCWVAERMKRAYVLYKYLPGVCFGSEQGDQGILFCTNGSTSIP